MGQFTQDAWTPLPQTPAYGQAGRRRSNLLEIGRFSLICLSVCEVLVIKPEPSRQNLSISPCATSRDQNAHHGCRTGSQAQKCMNN